jgi:soluble lytic murein transglycosylase-like protein
MNELDPEVLTTYAGILLRDLLDRFEGDVSLATGAYNGGPGNPNMRYEQWVQAASQHARKVVERSAALNGQPAVGMHWMLAR